MTTKEQERKALAQIRKIVEGLGSNSYVGTAFEGCFEIAEENIEYDFGCSMKQEIESYEKQIRQYKDIRDKLVEENREIKTAYEALKSTRDSEISLTNHNLEIAKKNAETAANWYAEESKKATALEAQVKEQAQTILELKARLYDYMVS